MAAMRAAWLAAAALLCLAGGVARGAKSEASQLLGGALRAEYCDPPGAGFGTRRDSADEQEDGALGAAALAGLRGVATRVPAVLQLEAVSAVIRHGDRSGMGDIPRTAPVSWDCAVRNESAVVRELLFRGHRPEYDHSGCLAFAGVARADVAHARQALVAADSALGQWRPNATAAGADALYRGLSLPPRCGPVAADRARQRPSPAWRGLLRTHYEGACDAGQLTVRGIEQHRRLGEMLRRRWGESPAVLLATAGAADTGLRLAEPTDSLVPAALDADRVVISSTNYGRTALSAAAFLVGMYPDRSLDLQPESREGMVPGPIGRDSVCEARRQRAHCRSRARVVRVVPRSTDVMLWAKHHEKCRRAQLLARTQWRLANRTAGGFVPGVLPARLVDRVATHLDVRADWIGGISPTEAGDVVTTRTCWGKPLPCTRARASSPPSRTRCLSADLALDIWNATHRDYEARYAGQHNRLMMFPALRALLAPLRLVAAGASRAGVHVRFAHDTVVYPLLSALGGGDGRWPSYAARISFELWVLRELSANSSSVTLDSTIDATAATALNTSASRATAAFPLVRVVYQGEDVTPRLPCARLDPALGAPGSLAAAAHALRGHLCSLSALEHSVARIIHPHRSHTAACKVDGSAVGDTEPWSAGALPLTADADGAGAPDAGPFAESMPDIAEQPLQ